MTKTRVDASPVILGAILVLLAAGAVVTYLSLRVDPMAAIFASDRVINTLFVVERNGKPLCTYVLMYYPATQRAAIFDIPSEVGQIISRINRVDRIDSVYEPGRIGLFEGEVENLLGVDISFAVVYTLENLGKILDLIEGVELLIPSTIHVFTDEGPIIFPAGITRLDGDKGIRYITYEIPEESEDLARFRRQRFFLGFLKRLGEQNNTLKKPQIRKLYESLAAVSLNPRAARDFFDALSGTDTDQMSMQSVGGNRREVSGQTLLIPSYDGTLIKEYVRQALGSLTRRIEGAEAGRVFTVEVLNGTPSSGLAGRTAELLRGFGYDVIAVGNADRSDYESTQIVDRSGYQDMVRLLGDVIHCSSIRHEPLAPEAENMEFTVQAMEYKSDFTLILGRDFDGRYVTH